jgi:hypothetical protein
MELAMAQKKDGTNWGCWAIAIVVGAIVVGPTILGIIGLMQTLGFFLGPIIVLALVGLSILGLMKGLKIAKGHALYPLLALKVRKATRPDTLLIGKLQKDAKAVLDLLKEHGEEPLVKALGSGIRKDVKEILRQGNMVLRSRQRLQKLHDSSKDAPKEILSLRAQLAVERDERVAASLKSALSSREQEIQNYADIRRSIRQLDGLLTEAQAGMAELKSRVGSAVVPANSLPHDPLRTGLAEATDKLRSVSHVMQKTLSELA